jgi:tetratricopeptide (TPR) repeat protein
MMAYLRVHGWKVAAIVLLLAVFTPSATVGPLFDAAFQARSAMINARDDLALSAIEQLITFQPQALSYRQSALQLAINMGYWDQARDHLAFLEQQGHDSPEMTCARAQLALHEGVDPEHSTEALLTLANCPDSLSLTRQIAEEDFQAGRYTTAIPLLETFVESGIARVVEKRNLAFYLAASFPEKAESLLREVQDTNDETDSLALRLLITIQDHQPQSSDAYIAAQIGREFLQNGYWQLAQVALERAVTIDPQYAQAWAYLGVAQDRLGLDGGEAYNQSLSIVPDEPLFLVLLGAHYNDHDQPAEALVVLEKAAMLDAENPAIAAELGRSYVGLGDLEAARLAYRQSTILAPQQASFWGLLAEFSFTHEMDIDTLGLPASRNALILQPGESAYWRLLGQGHYLLGNHYLAHRMLIASTNLSPSDPGAHYFLGLNYQAQGKNEQALAAWRMAVSLNPNQVYGQLSSRAITNTTEAR